MHATGAGAVRSQRCFDIVKVDGFVRCSLDGVVWFFGAATIWVRKDDPECIVAFVDRRESR